MESGNITSYVSMGICSIFDENHFLKLRKTRQKMYPSQWYQL